MATYDIPLGRLLGVAGWGGARPQGRETAVKPRWIPRRASSTWSRPPGRG